MQTAIENRYEVKIAEEFIEQRSFERKAAKAERYPRVDFVSDYGSSGNTPFNNTIGTYSVGVRVSVPIYNGGATGGRISIAKSRERQAELELGNLRGTITQDARLALVDLDTAIQQVRTADNTFQLAERELDLARGRYSAGVGENIELTNAQIRLKRRERVASTRSPVTTPPASIWRRHLDAPNLSDFSVSKIQILKVKAIYI